MLENVQSIEIFAAKDGVGLFIAAPARCGLKQADTLRVAGDTAVVLQKDSILPVDLPELTAKERGYLLKFATTGQKLPVGEFMASGLVDSYFLRLEID